MPNLFDRQNSLRGIRILALWAGLVAVILQVMSQVLTVPSGFGIEDYLGWVSQGGGDDPVPALFDEWEKKYKVVLVARAYLVVDTVVFMPLYGALLLTLTDKFMLAAARDRAVGGSGIDQTPLLWWSSIFAAMLAFLLVVDLIENIFGLIRLDAPGWAYVSLIGLIVALVVSTSRVSWWWRDFREYGRLLHAGVFAGTIVILCVACAVILVGSDVTFSPVVWAHRIKTLMIHDPDIGLLHIYLVALALLVAAWFFGFFFDAQTAAKKQDEESGEKPVSQAYEQRSRFRRELGDIILRSRYVLVALVVFTGLAVLMDQGRDVLYSAASHHWKGLSLLVLTLSALGMWAFSFACWLWARSVNLIRSPDTPKESCPADSDPARLADRFARDWARFLGLMPPVLFLLLCGATLRDAVWAGDSSTLWALGAFSLSAALLCVLFVFFHWRDTETHFYNLKSVDDWLDAWLAGEGKHTKYRFLRSISPFQLPFFAAVMFFVSRLISGVEGAPPALVPSMLFALTFWLSVFGWISINEERIAVPWVGLLIVAGGVFGYAGWTQNHLVIPVADESSSGIRCFLGALIKTVLKAVDPLIQLVLDTASGGGLHPLLAALPAMLLAALLLALFAVFVAFNSTKYFAGLRGALAPVGLAKKDGASGLPFLKGALFVVLSVFLAEMVFAFTDHRAGQAIVRQSSAGTRQDLDTALGEWLRGVYDDRAALHRKGDENESVRVYFVNSEGGGIRAAYWTAAVLRELRGDATFARRTFSYSGVSGGSVGMAVDRACQIGESDHPGSAPKCVEQFGKTDLLSDLISGWLFEDVIGWLLPSGWCTTPGCGFLSRGVLFERALLRSSPHLRTGLEQSRIGLVTGEGRSHEPYLFLNSTWVESGDRAIASEIKIAPAPGADVIFPRAIDQIDLLSSISLATAAHNSARFPFTNAIGAVKTGNRNCPWKSDSGNLCGHLADGGYFDNSGGHTTQDILRALARCLAPENQPAACKALLNVSEKDEKTTKAEWLRQHLVPQVIVIRNGVNHTERKAPASDNPNNSAPCRKPDPLVAKDVRSVAYAPDDYDPAQPGCKGELKLYVDQLGPLITAINTTGIGANGKLAEANLKREVESVCRSLGGSLCGNERYRVVNIEQVEDHKSLYPLGWHLSTSALNCMQAQLDEPRFDWALEKLGLERDKAARTKSGKRCFETGKENAAPKS